jgi:integrase
MGCVYRAPRNRNDIWFLKYRVPNPTGDGFTYKVESSGTTDKAAAKVLLAKRETDVAEGKPVGQTAGRRNAYTFEAARDAIIADYKLRNKRGSARVVERRIDLHLAPVFGGRRMSEITTDAIAQYAAMRLEPAEDGTPGAAPAQVQIELRTLSRMYTLGIKATRLSWKPVMPQVAVENARQGFFERADFAAVRAKMPEHFRDLLTLAYWTGWRMQNELASLEWRHVDLDGRELRLFTSKNGEGRVFPYGSLPDVCDAMDRLAARRERFREAGIITARVFVDGAGTAVAMDWPSQAGPQMVQEFRVAWKAACTAAGVTGRIPHDLRRTAVRNLIAAGVSEKVAMTITGHKTRSVFDRYHIVNTSDLNDALGKLAARAARPAAAPATAPRRRRSRAA